MRKSQNLYSICPHPPETEHKMNKITNPKGFIFGQVFCFWFFWDVTKCKIPSEIFSPLNTLRKRRCDYKKKSVKCLFLCDEVRVHRNKFGFLA